MATGEAMHRLVANISREHKMKLNLICKHTRRSKTAQVEVMIDRAYEENAEAMDKLIEEMLSDEG